MLAVSEHPLPPTMLESVLRRFNGMYRGRDGSDTASLTSPSPKPVSLDWTSVSRVNSNYLVGPKSDGERYHLMIAKVDGEMLSVMISETLKVYVVQVAASRVSFDGTLIDGEVVSKDGQLVFLAFDIVWLNGVKLASESLVQRACIIHRILDFEGDVHSQDEIKRVVRSGYLVSCNNLNGLVFRSRPWYPIGDLARVPFESKDGADGLILAKIDAPIRPGKNTEMFKFKLMHTLDLMLVKLDSDPVNDNPSYSIQCNAGMRHEEIHIMRDDRKLTFQLASTAKIPVMKTGDMAIMECQVELGDYPGVMLVTPLKVRTDKEVANHVSTIEKTIPAIEKKMTFEALVDAVRRTDGGGVKANTLATSTRQQRDAMRMPFKWDPTAAHIQPVHGTFNRRSNIGTRAAPPPPPPSFYNPEPAAYQPAPAAYQPVSAPAAYQPAPTAYQPAPAAYQPAPTAYEPVSAPAAYEPVSAPTAYEPVSAPAAYEPVSAPAAYDPAPATYQPVPAPVTYQPAPAAYDPAPATYQPVPAPTTYQPAPAAYEPASPAYGTSTPPSMSAQATYQPVSPAYGASTPPPEHASPAYGASTPPPEHASPANGASTPPPGPVDVTDHEEQKPAVRRRRRRIVAS